MRAKYTNIAFQRGRLANGTYVATTTSTIVRTEKITGFADIVNEWRPNGFETEVGIWSARPRQKAVLQRDHGNNIARCILAAISLSVGLCVCGALKIRANDRCACAVSLAPIVTPQACLAKEMLQVYLTATRRDAREAFVRFPCLCIGGVHVQGVLWAPVARRMVINFATFLFLLLYKAVFVLNGAEARHRLRAIIHVTSGFILHQNSCTRYASKLPCSGLPSEWLLEE